MHVTLKEKRTSCFLVGSHFLKIYLPQRRRVCLKYLQGTNMNKIVFSSEVINNVSKNAYLSEFDTKDLLNLNYSREYIKSILEFLAGNKTLGEFNVRTLSNLDSKLKRMFTLFKCCTN